MKLRDIIFFLLLKSLLVTTACKDASSVGDGPDQGIGVELVEAEHVLYSEEILLPVGTVVTTKENRSISDATVKITIPAQPAVNGIMTKVYDLEQLTTIKGKGNISIDIKRDQSFSRAIIRGQPAPQPDIDAPLNGALLSFTRNGRDPWVGKLENGNASPKQADAIDKLCGKLNNPDARVLFGPEPRKVGDKWEIDPSQLYSFAGGTEKMKGKFELSFRSIEKHQGLDCAVIVARINLEGEDDSGMQMLMSGRATILQSLKYRTQISFEMEGNMTMDSRIMNGIGDMRIEGVMLIKREADLSLP